jgi:DNA-binding NarL/FixJ family response regulator/tetratricopeptide (TPR) repeat protein
LVDALDDHLAGFDRGRLNPDLELLCSIFPSLRGPGPQDVVAACERYRVFRAVRRLLETLPSQGLVLLLDDLQWADEDTGELLAQLLRRPPRRPLLLAFAYRWRQAPVRLRAAVAVAGGDCPPVCLRLSPLSQAEAEAMLAGRGSRSWRCAVYHASGGNPFYLDALARSALGQEHPGNGGTAGNGSGGEDIPPAVAAALIAELAALSPAGQLSARSAAVIGDSFSASTAGEVAGLDEERAATAIAELAAADLIRPIDRTPLFSFRHALVRSAIYESANSAWRVAAHGRAAAALRNRGAPLTAQAHHIERAADFGDLRAVGLLSDAASTVQMQAPATAAHWLRAALRLLPEGNAATVQRTALLLRLAFALGAAGHAAESRNTLHAVLRQLGHDRPDQRVHAVTFCALMERQLGRHAEGQALLLAELPALGDQEIIAAAAVRYELGCGELTGGDLALSRGWAEEALAALQGGGPAGLRAAVLGLLAIVEVTSGDVPNALAHLAGGAALLDGMLDGELEQRLDAALWVGCGEFFLERHDSALRHLDRGLALAHENGQVLALAPLLIGRVLVLLGTGQLSAASTAAEEAVEVAASAGSGEQQSAALALRCWVAAWIGDLDVARSAEAAAIDQPPVSLRSWLAVLAAGALSSARLAMDDPEGCLALAAAGAALPGPAAWARVGWCELLTRAELAAGRGSAAARWAEAAMADACLVNLPGRIGLALLAQAQASTATDPDTAYDLAVAAGHALDDAGLVLDAGRAALAGASALAARGDLDQASDAARAAQSIFESCGAGLLARRAAGLRRRLAGVGSRGNGGRADGADHGVLTGLTRREQQVAGLVSQGLTNRHISRRLHVTEKTIEKHLSNVFAKLGVSSRTEAAAAVIRARET